MRGGRGWREERGRDENTHTHATSPLCPFPPPRPANPPHPGKSPMVVYGQTKDGKNVQYRNRPSLVSTDIVEG